jgi:hypothetical protein
MNSKCGLNFLSDAYVSTVLRKFARVIRVCRRNAAVFAQTLFLDELFVSLAG